MIEAILLLQLIDIENFGFSLSLQEKLEKQKVYIDLCQQSFLGLHQKLNSLIEPLEVLANTDIDIWLYGNLRGESLLSNHGQNMQADVQSTSEVQVQDNSPSPINGPSRFILNPASPSVITHHKAHTPTPHNPPSLADFATRVEKPPTLISSGKYSSHQVIHKQIVTTVTNTSPSNNSPTRVAVLGSVPFQPFSLNTAGAHTTNFPNN